MDTLEDPTVGKPNVVYVTFVTLIWRSMAAMMQDSLIVEGQEPTNARPSKTTRIRRRTRMTPLGVASVVTSLTCLVLFVWPVVMIVLGSFRSGYPGVATGWTLDPLVEVFTDPHTGKVLGTSAWIALLVTVLSKSLSFYLAWLVARTNTPLRKLISPILLISLALPPTFFVIAWGLLGQERVGLLNQVISHFTGEPSTLINVNSFAGVVVVSALKSVAFGYFMLLGPMHALSHRMEEAAAIAGAGRFRTFWTVNVPIMAPAFGAVIILGFIRGLEYFEAPLILGKQANVEVISTQLYSYLNDDYPPKFGHASVLATIVLMTLIVLLVGQTLITRRRNYETVGGKGGNTAPWDLGPWKYVGTVVFALFALFALVLPIVQLVLASLQPYFGATAEYTMDNYQSLFSNRSTAEAMRNTAQLGVCAGLAVMLIALSIIFVTRHGAPRLGNFISRSTWLPFSMPGPALALGILWILLSVPLLHSLYGSFSVMFLALVIVAMPVAMRNLEPAALQVGRDLEESAWISGAGKARAFASVVARLILPSFLSGWLLSGIIIAGNLTMPLMVGSPLLNSVPKTTYELYSSGAGPAAAALSMVFLVSVGGIFVILLILQKVLMRIIARPIAVGSDDAVAPKDPVPTPAPTR